MSLYKYETHMHTSQGSDCSSTDGAVMVEKLKELGYTGCFVTDHFFGGNTAVPRDFPWDVKVHLFCQGYEAAKRRGDEIGLDVYFGLEFGWFATEFLTYGIDKQFLLDHPEVERMDLDHFAQLVHDNGGFVVHAHPFRQAGYIRTIRLYPGIVDGVEIENCGNAPEYNARAKWYAESYGLPATGGSDAHHWFNHPGGGIALDEKLKDPLDYLNRLKTGRITRILTKDESIMQPWPKDDVWAKCVRPSIGLLPDELKPKAREVIENRAK